MLHRLFSKVKVFVRYNNPDYYSVQCTVYSIWQHHGYCINSVFIVDMRDASHMETGIWIFIDENIILLPAFLITAVADRPIVASSMPISSNSMAEYFEAHSLSS